VESVDRVGSDAGDNRVVGVALDVGRSLAAVLMSVMSSLGSAEDILYRRWENKEILTSAQDIGTRHVVKGGSE